MKITNFVSSDTETEPIKFPHITEIISGCPLKIMMDIRGDKYEENVHILALSGIAAHSAIFNSLQGLSNPVERAVESTYLEVDDCQRISPLDYEGYEGMRLRTTLKKSASHALDRFNLWFMESYPDKDMAIEKIDIEKSLRLRLEIDEKVVELEAHPDILLYETSGSARLLDLKNTYRRSRIPDYNIIQLATYRAFYEEYGVNPDTSSLLYLKERDMNKMEYVLTSTNHRVGEDEFIRRLKGVINMIHTDGKYVEPEISFLCAMCEARGVACRGF